jgi:hypothetical protein
MSVVSSFPQAANSSVVASNSRDKFFMVVFFTKVAKFGYIKEVAYDMTRYTLCYLRADWVADIFVEFKG